MSSQKIHDNAADAGELRRKRFYYIRVTVLSCILVAVLAYAYVDFRDRSRRNDWERTLEVGIVLLPRKDVPDALLEAFSARFSTLAQRLDNEFSRYRNVGHPPFGFAVLGSVRSNAAVPNPGSGGLWETLRTNYELRRFTGEIDDQLSQDPRSYDSRIYVSISAPKEPRRTFVEGFSEQGGRVGVVVIELNERNIDFALFVVAHELFHTLGAQDKYGSDGRVLMPEGFAEPERDPLWPQRFAEVMARNRPVSPDHEVPPDKLDQLAVGERTAREVGWLVP